MLSPRQKFVKNLTLPLAAFIFLLLFAVDIFFVPSATFSDPKNIKISDDFSPRIDSAAVMVGRDEGSIPLCTTLPGELWIFLLVAYIFLLFFNLFYDFEHATEIHWFWESLYALLALWGWYVWDECRLNIWFPLYVLKLGIVVYLAYLNFFYKKKEIEPMSDEILEIFEG